MAAQLHRRGKLNDFIRIGPEEGRGRERHRKIFDLHLRALRWRQRRVLAVVVVLLLLLPELAHAGGPSYVAGVSYFNSGTAGTPLTWAQGAVNYYTDQGDLSSQLPGASADAFVAAAFGQWTSIATAAVATTHAGQLAEDVSGANVTVNSDGSINMPADIQPTAVNTPVGVVYDADGSVTDALLGQGASDAGYCYINGAFGGIDNLGVSANFLHALVVLNGNCAQTSSQLPDLEYHLVRLLGRVLGLDWSQLNLNVITDNPPPTSGDYSGFTIMHAVDPANCIPVSLCYPNADQPKMDDQAALSRLYPVTSQNLGNFPGKQIFSQSTARIHGTLYFTNPSNQPAQGMQGVNVVARWIDPSTGQPSRAYAAASLSGFLFSGNAGNPATGFNDPTGLPYNRFGSNDPTLEGFFDLAGLQIPNGASSAQYQLTVEAVDPLWSQLVGPYQPWQVEPSGTALPVTVTVNLGGDVLQDIFMQNSAVQTQDWFGPTTYAAPAAVPSGGDWESSLSGYGLTDYFWFTGQNNRTLSVVVTALDESGNTTQSKSMPVVGMWELADPGTFPAPAATPIAFNTIFFGESRLDAALLGSSSFRIGISDYRGDGRPDYRYHARLFYGDTVVPARVSVAGGTPLAVQGLGFQQNTTVSAGNAAASLLAASATQLIFSAPSQPDGIQDLALSDAATGANSTLTGALTYGAAPSDLLLLLAGSNPSTPVGGQAANPIRVQVVASDGATPVAGASVVFSSAPAASLLACGGAASCTVLTDQTGQASTYVTVLTAAVMTITAQLAPASYSSPQQVQTTLNGTSSALDIALAPQYSWIAQGATVDVPLKARLLSNGSAVSGRGVNYYLTKGSGTFSSSTTTTDANGYAATTLHVSAIAGDVQVSACAEPGDVPCQTFYGTAVPANVLQMQAVSGSTQILPSGQNFQPVSVRVTDSSSPPNSVTGASVLFQSIVGRLAQNTPVFWVGGVPITGTPNPVILSSSATSVLSDGNGLAAIQPTIGGFQGDLVILGTATTGAGSIQFQLESLTPVTSQQAQTRNPVAPSRRDGIW